MKVLLAYEWCQVGGVEAFMASLAVALRARGHKAEFFFFERGPMEKYLPAECEAHFGDMTDCLRLVRERGFDLVHANSSDLIHGIPSVRAAGARLVITAHGMVVPGWNSTNCDAFACVSQWQTDAQKVFTDLPVRTIYNGVDTTRFRPPDAAETLQSASPIIAWVGRGTDMVHKRIDRLAAIAPALRAAGLRIRIADPYGPEKVAEVVPEAARVLRETAEFWGEVSKDGLPRFYREAGASGGLILSTSVREGFGMVLAEAQACGCPAVGPDVVGVNEVVRPEHGGVIYPPDIEPGALASLVVETVRDEERMRARREACARFARAQFDLERMADEYVRLYEEALKRETRRSFASGARYLLAPVTGWREYVERRWTAGRALYEVSRQLSARGEVGLARSVARMSFETCPTQFAKPQRLARLCGALLRRAKASDAGREVGKRRGEAV
jgi:glycosyltransferase involved in cell wall biosynthesis